MECYLRRSSGKKCPMLLKLRISIGRYGVNTKTWKFNIPLETVAERHIKSYKRLARGVVRSFGSGWGGVLACLLLAQSLTKGRQKPTRQHQKSALSHSPLLITILRTRNPLLGITLIWTYARGSNTCNIDCKQLYCEEGHRKSDGARVWSGRRVQ